jgi:hypothetical protein
MPKYIQVGSDVIEFPDDMSDAQIAQVLRQQEERRKRLLAMPYSEIVQGTENMPDTTTPVQVGPAARKAVGLVRSAMIKPFEAATQVFGGEEGRRGVAEREAAYQAMRQRIGEEGIEGADIAGQILSPLNLIPAAKIIQAIGTTTRTGRVIGTGLGAAVGGATQPVAVETESLVDFALEKTQQFGINAVLGGFVQGGIEGLKGGATLVKNLAKPMSEKGREKILQEFVQKLAGPDREKFAAALSNVDNFVTGSRPTAAEALSDFPSSVNIAAAQERIARTPGGAPVMASRAAEQQAARLGLLGDETAIPQMQSLREGMTAPVRQEALEQANVAGQVLPGLEEGIAAREASRIQALQQQGQMQTMAAQQGVLAQQPFTPIPGLPRVSSKYSPNIDRAAEAIDTAKQFGDVAAQRMAERNFKQLQVQSLADEGFYPLKTDGIVDKLDNMLTDPKILASDLKTKTLQSIRSKLSFSPDNPQNIVNQRGIIDSTALYEVRKQIGDEIAKFAKETGTSDAKVLAGLETSLKGIIDNSIEAAGGVRWKDYLKDYAKYSEKVNRLQIGQQLAKALNSPLNVERAAAFANAVDNAAQTIKRASGAPRYKTLGAVLTPEETAAVNAIKADLQRSAKADELAKSARDLGIDMSDTDIPQLLNQTIAITNAILRKMKSGKAEMLNQEAAQLFADPKKFAAFLSAVPKGKAQAFVDRFMSRLSPENQQVMINILNTADLAEQVVIRQAPGRLAQEEE